MVEYLMEKIEWPGRRVRSTAPGRKDPPDPSPSASQDEDLSDEDRVTPGQIPPLIDPDNGPSVRASLDAAARALSKFEDTVDDMLDDSVSVDTSKMPQANEAARLINGTHPIYARSEEKDEAYTGLPSGVGDEGGGGSGGSGGGSGSTEDGPVDNDAVPVTGGNTGLGGFPAIPEEDKTGDGSGEINADTFRTAHEILERPDQNVLGIDVEEAVMESGPGETIRPYQPVKTPREAAGRDDVGRRSPTQLPEAFETTEKEKKMSIWKRAALPIASICVRFVGDLVYKVGDTIKNMFMLRIPLPGPDFKISLSRPIATGFYMIANVLYDLADYLMDLALGQDPRQRPPNDNRDLNAEGDSETVGTQPEDSFVPSGGTLQEGSGWNENSISSGVSKNEMGDLLSYPAAMEETPESLGDQLTMAAAKVVEATTQEANNRTDPSLATALRAYDQAKRTRTALRNTNQIATAVGVPTSIADATTDGGAAASPAIIDRTQDGTAADPSTTSPAGGSADPVVIDRTQDGAAAGDTDDSDALPGSSRSNPTPVATEQAPFEECE